MHIIFHQFFIHASCAHNLPPTGSGRRNDQWSFFSTGLLVFFGACCFVLITTSSGS
jgi:hypothetical protein